MKDLKKVIHGHIERNIKIYTILVILFLVRNSYGNNYSKQF